MKRKPNINNKSFGRCQTWPSLCTITFSLLAAMPAAQAASATWSATPVDSLWSTEANWSAAPVPGAGDTATFGTNTVAATIDTGTISLTTLNFTGANGSAYTIGGATAGTGQITFADGTTSAVTNSGQANVTINANIILGTAAVSNTSFASGNNKNLTLAGSITVGTGGTSGAKTLAIAGFNSANSSVIISGAITDNVNSSLRLTKAGANTLTLSNAGNSFTGGMHLQTGQTNVSSLAALGSATTGLITLGIGNQSAAILNFTGSPGSLSRQVQIGSGNGAGTGTINNNAANGSTPLVFTNALFNSQIANTNTAGRVLTLGGANTDANEIQGTIRDNTGAGALIAVTKADAGTWTLSGANSYTGATNVNGGKLTIASTGAINTTSQVNIDAGEFNYNSSTALTQNIVFSTGGILSGNGTINTAVNVTTGNTLAIGNSVGSMNFGGNLTVGGTYSYELMGGGSTADLGDVTGDLTLGGILDLVQLGTYTAGQKFTLFAYDGALSGLFTDVGATTIADDTDFMDAGGIWTLNYNDTTAGLNGGTGTSFVTITAIPEPSAALLGGLGLLALLRRRRN